MQTAFLLFFITFSLSLSIAYLALLKRLQETNAVLFEIFMANKTIETLISSNTNYDLNESSDAHKENFIKFLSESRDWAFEYIEQTQSVVQEVADYLSNKNNDFDKAYAKKLQALLSEERKS